MHHRSLALAALLVVLVSPSLAALDINDISLAGQVTHVDLENSFFVVSPGGRDVMVPCGPGNVWCDQLTYGDEVVISGHFGDAAEVCGGLELPDNPIVVDGVDICKEGECIPLTGPGENEKNN